MYLTNAEGDSAYPITVRLRAGYHNSRITNGQRSSTPQVARPMPAPRPRAALLRAARAIVS